MSEHYWQPWETRPLNGDYFIATNGKEVIAGNEPKGCAFGNWRREPRFNGGWMGSFIRLDKPLLWAKLPMIPETNEHA
jgi:hypothetical protein